MLSAKTLICFALLFAVAVAFNDTDDDVDRRGGHHGGKGHHGRGGHGHHGGRGHGGRGHGGRGHGRGGHGRHHCHHHHHHHHGLTFFKDLNETVKQQFIEIWRDEDLTRDEKKAHINELAETVLTPEQLEEFHKNQAEREQKKKQWREEMDKKVAELSPEARTAAEKIRAIWRDETASGPESWKLKKEKTHKIKEALSESARTELEGLWEHRWGRRCGGFLSRLSFYDDLDQSIKDQFTAVFRNDDLKWGEKKEKINQLAQTLFTPEQLSEFEKMKADFEQRKKQRQAEMDAKIATLSPNARAAAENIRAIFRDESLEWSDKRTQIRDIKKELSESEQSELDSLRPRGHWRRGGRSDSSSQSDEKNEKNDGEADEAMQSVISAADI